MSLLLATVAALGLQTAPDPAEAEIAAVLDRLNAASTAADTTAYFGLFTPDARFIGTDATERWSLPEFRAYVEPYFARGRGWTYMPSARVITIAPIDCRCVAWFDEELANATYGQTRGSGVLRLTDGGWKIEQYVLSFAVPNDRAAAVVAAIKAE
ncbi:nuclear transport factor 2 family protein [Brevundimonas sp. TWP2-3-4b2]|uniref:nuclear transport factor 2 family protein n=1 Tax=Brevundimonas sp. TWP2-3-4b2 TaxID=2804595 RepID=UPI003CE705CE